jgi:hypothetical protein
MSRAIMTSSAAAGVPRSPRRSAVAPSFIDPAVREVRVLLVHDDGRSNMRVYSSARAHEAGVHHRAAVVGHATMPARCISPISASALALEPHRQRADRIDAGARARRARR